MQFNLKTKLSSRKFWITVITIISGLTSYFISIGIGDVNIWSLVLTVVAAVAYILTEGAVDFASTRISTSILSQTESTNNYINTINK
ncbi:MAG: hypothetical protein A2Y17_03795 [Clostridiales bacterium GWF2_38_85]|nr:MAG: hypothetical protein A2Y17_03795 [Clostridiales bacterium GWF2_38_85]HBL83918.1 hypothetical protein [Clostridiales bacterium]